MKLFRMLKGATQNRGLTNILTVTNLELWKVGQVDSRDEHSFIWVRQKCRFGFSALSFPIRVGKLLIQTVISIRRARARVIDLFFPDSPPRWTNAINTMIKQSERFNHSTLSLVRSQLNSTVIILNAVNNDDVRKSFDLQTCDSYGSDKAHPRSKLANIIQAIYLCTCYNHKQL